MLFRGIDRAADRVQWRSQGHALRRSLVTVCDAFPTRRAFVKVICTPPSIESGVTCSRPEDIFTRHKTGAKIIGLARFRSDSQGRSNASRENTLSGGDPANRGEGDPALPA